MRIRWRQWAVGLAAAVWLAGQVVLWLALPPQPRLTLPGVSSHARPAVSADGRRLVIKTADQVQILDMDSGRRLAAVPCPAEVLDTIIPSPDGRWLLAYDCSRQRPLLIDSAAGLTIPQTPMANLNDDLFSRCCRFSPDGRTAALVAPDEEARDFTVRLWDVEAGAERAIFRGAIYPVAFAPDGRTLATTDYGPDARRHLRLWDVAAGRLRGAIPAVDWPLWSLDRLAFSPDGQSLLGTGVEMAGGWRVVTWDLTDRRVRSARLDEPRAAWAPDGLLMVLSANPARQVMRIETRDPDNGMSLAVQHFGEVGDAITFLATGSPRVDFSDDGRFLLARLSHAAPAWARWLTQRLPASRGLVSDAHRAAVHVWECRTGRPEVTLWRETEYALLAPDGRTLVTVEPDGALRLWDVPLSKPLAWFAGGTVMLALPFFLLAGWRVQRLRRRVDA